MVNRLVITFCLSGLLLFSCKQEEKVPDPYMPTDAYDAYVHGLRETGLFQSALGSTWIEASESAIENPLEIPIPYAEEFFLPSDHPKALGFRFAAKRGQVVELNISPGQSDSTFIFVDLYRILNDSLKQYQHVATADSTFNTLKFEPRKDADYIVRIIPELLRGGSFTMEIKNLPLLAFPVTGKDKWAIQSKFGAPRDAGRRTHHGVDIFARRHTPIIAPFRAYVSKVDTAKLGGRVVWLKDSKRRLNLYFAHLQEQLVDEGVWVEKGDTIGTVGNTGNARTTPPHLHFGIYSRGPVDPYEFIVPWDTVSDPIKANRDLLGEWIRTKQKVSLRTKYGSKYKVIRDYNAGTLIKVEGVAGNYYRVSQADGEIGYVLARVTESISKPIGEITLSKSQVIIPKPDLPGSVKGIISAGDTVEVLGRFEDDLYVRTQEGKSGWTSSQ